MTHKGAAIESLISLLEQNPKIHVFETGTKYQHHEDLGHLWSCKHRNDNAAAWWVDVITQNGNFSCRELAKYCKFLYFLASPDYSLPRIELKPVNAAAYYRFRIRGLVQWWSRTNGPWIDCEEEVKNSVELLLPELAFDYQTKTKPQTSDVSEVFFPKLMEECHRAFIKYKQIVHNGQVSHLT
jgi:hypothetical protein